MLPVKPTVSLCDAKHQAIAFVGTCPICRVKPSERGVPRPLEHGTGTFVSELDRVLREYYTS